MKSEVLRKRVSGMPPIPVFSIAAAALAGLAWAAASPIAEAAAALWLWGAAVFVPYYAAVGNFGPHYRKFPARAAGAACLCLSVLLSGTGHIDAAVAALVFAPALYFGNFKILAVAAVPVLIWTVLVPNAEYAHFIISYPMRIVGAEMSAALLSCLGFAAEAAGTNVTVAGREIAITSACSGIEQLEAMLFAGWACAAFMHSKTWERLAHFAMILPLIMLVNSLRLAATLAGYETFGEIFLSDGMHVGLGFASVVLITGLFIAAGTAFGGAKREGK